MKKTKTLTATSLRSLLIVALLLTIAATCFGFYQAKESLKEFATTVGQTIASSEPSTMSDSGISALEQALTARQDSIDKAAALSIPAADYQSQAINDLTKYASDTEITITNYSVPDAVKIAPTGAGLSGIESKYLTFTIQNPVRINSLIKFLSLVETNLPKMQLTGINLTQSSNSDMVNIDPLIVEIYTE